MRLSEILIQLLMFSLLTAIFCSGYLSFINSQKRILEKKTQITEIMKTDFEIRKLMDEMKVPYWKRTERNYLDEINKNLSEISEKAVVHIVNFNVLKKGEAVVGVKINWNYRERSYETKVYF